MNHWTVPGQVGRAIAKVLYRNEDTETTRIISAYEKLDAVLSGGRYPDFKTNLMELAMELEHHYRIKLTDEELDSFVTVGDLEYLVDHKLDRHDQEEYDMETANLADLCAFLYLLPLLVGGFLVIRALVIKQ